MADPKTIRPVVKKEPGVEQQREKFGVTQVNVVCIGLKRGEDAISLKVQKQDKEDANYRMGKNVKLEVMMMDYCDCKGLGWGTIQFLGPEGDLLCRDQTPKDLCLEDGDAIDAMFNQLGGQYI